MTDEISQTRLTQIRKSLLRWYESNGRDFPWRTTSSPYEILVAEMMLRRTTATAVSHAYPDFLNRFPDVKTLSISKVDDIEKSIQSLGLQSQRASHLLMTAKVIVNEYDGKILSAKDHLEELPGVGRYVAAAVRNFAFGEPVQMVDGNIMHLLQRVLGVIYSSPSDESVWQTMKALGGRKQNKHLYWGIIDIVALLCLRKNPRCSMCPLNDQCAFNASR